ncbi:MAG TPA: RusA family crossover junction endodeoxyribonuclease [Rhabdochlamydiaceae bacterium]
MIARFIIPGRLSGTNDIIRMAAYNRFAGGARRKQEKTACAIQIERQNKQRIEFKNPVLVSFSWIEPNNKRDLDNITGGQKVIFDALVMLGILQNDTREWVRGISHSFPTPDKEKPRIEIEIRETF